MRAIIVVTISFGLLFLSGCRPSTTALPEPTATSVPPTEAPAMPTHPDVAYVDDGDPRHILDIYLPEGEADAFPTLFGIHGPGGTKEDLNGLAGYFIKRGYAVVLTSYRYPFELSRPLMFQDAMCSLAWVHDNADSYGFDRERIVVFGYSLGGLVAATLGTVDDTSLLMEGCPHPLPESGWTQGTATFAAVLVTPEVCLTASWCMAGAAEANKRPVTQMLEIFEDLREVPPSTWLDSRDISEEARIFAQTLPLSWVDGSEPPFLLIHGSNDDVVPSGESEAFATWLEGAGVEVELMLLPSAGHFSIVPSSPSFLDIAEAVEAFAAGR